AAAVAAGAVVTPGDGEAAQPDDGAVAAIDADDRAGIAALSTQFGAARRRVAVAVVIAALDGELLAGVHEQLLGRPGLVPGHQDDVGARAHTGSVDSGLEGAVGAAARGTASAHVEDGGVDRRSGEQAQQYWHEDP